MLTKLEKFYYLMTRISDKKLLIVLNSNNCTLNDYLIIEALYTKQVDTIYEYLFGKTDAQKIAFMNGSIRRGFIEKSNILFRGLDFSINDYTLTSKATILYEKIIKLLKII
jgi:hypothetical protein